MYGKASNFPTYAIFAAINFGCSVHLSQGMDNCEYEECIFAGYTCKNNKCVCDPEEPALFRCIPPKSYGESCNSDQECQLSDYNLYCVKSDARICKCKRSYIWDSERKKCLPTLDDDLYIGRFDPVRELVIPVIIIVTIGAMVYLGLKLFCNCGKLWRRRRRQEITRELEEISATPHQQATWIASYRVFSPYGNAARPPPGLFLPSQLSTSPPSYEEALKHKVILSSYHPAAVPAYTLPPPDASRQYQTLPANASAGAASSSSPASAFALNANNSATRRPGHRPPVSQTDAYAGLSTSHDPVWGHHFYSVTTEQLWSHLQAPRTGQEIPTVHGDSAVTPDVFRNLTPIDLRPHQHTRNPHQPPLQPPSVAQQVEAQSRASTFRPTQPARIYQSNVSEPTRTCDMNR